MAREHNFLLGQGERLASKVPIRKAGGEKGLPYDLRTAKARIAERLARVDAQITQLPDDACPRGEAVAVVTLHPRFLSKSDYPSELLSAVGLRAVGSRSRTIRPEKWGVERHGDDAVTEDIFVAGAKSAFHRWATSVKRWTKDTKGATSLSHIEDLTAFDAKAKLRGIPDGKGVLLEGVVDIVEDGSSTVMYDLKTYLDADAARDHVEPHYRQLNVYAHIWKGLRGRQLDKVAVIATRPTRPLYRALRAGEPAKIQSAMEAWDPVLEVTVDGDVVAEVMESFGRVVDLIEDRKFSPPGLEVLKAPSRPDGKVPFAQDVCLNCDARFGCASYRQLASRSRRAEPTRHCATRAPTSAATPRSKTGATAA